jgi:long-chain fatty acid transport protein
MYRFLGVILLVVLLGLAGAGMASAQGFGVYEQGACMMGRGGAGVADPCADGSGVFFNPAALSFDAKVITLGGTMIGPTGTFTDTSTTSMKGTVSTLNKKWYPVPNIYMTLPFAKKYAFGVGVFAPYGLTTDWPVASQGRYLGYKSVVEGLYIQPTFAVKINDKVSVGFGVDVTHLNVELYQRADLSTQALGTTGLTFAQLNLLCPASICGTVPQGTDFADIQLKGNTWNYGYHVGAQFKVNDRFSIGMRYLGGQKVDVPDGAIATTQISVPGVKVPVAGPGGTTFIPVDTVLKPQFDAGGTLSNQSAKTSIPLPAQFVAGVAIKASQSVKLFFDYQFTNWSAFDNLTIDGQYLDKNIPESYKNTSGFRMGTEIGSEKAQFRAGFNVHGPAAPDQSVTPNLPEGSRQELMLGFGSKLSKAFRLDLSYMYLHQPDRAGRTGAGVNPAAPTPADNNGTYSFTGHLFGLSMSIRF